MSLQLTSKNTYQYDQDKHLKVTAGYNVGEKGGQVVKIKVGGSAPTCWKGGGGGGGGGGGEAPLAPHS